MAEKVEPGRQFNDLAAPAGAWSPKLKEELSACRRLEWIRPGPVRQAPNKRARRSLSGIGPAATQVKDPQSPPTIASGSQLRPARVKVIPPLTNPPSRAKTNPAANTEARAAPYRFAGAHPAADLAGEYHGPV